MGQNFSFDTFPQGRLFLTGEVVSYTGTTVGTLNPPAEATLAEMQIQGVGIRFAYVSDPSIDGIELSGTQSLELESKDEINKFKFVGLSPVGGKLVVNYFKNNIPNT